MENVQKTHQNWWASKNRDGLRQRIAAIQKINDPTTNADEMLKGARIFIVLLLAFSGLLGCISYYKNFSGAFPWQAALFMAAALTVAIEWGKNYCCTWAVRLPFFHGFRHIGATPANTFMFVGLIGVAAATFAMSIYNSTRGGHQLATMLSQERNAVAFSPDTRAIDDQIASTRQSIAANREVKWKGTVTYQAQKAIQSESKSLDRLISQRETTIQQQRTDFERLQGQQDNNTSYTANLVMASGGWVELLQALLILFRVACEKALDGRQAPASPAPTLNGQHFSHNGAATYQNRIGFNIGDDGNVRSTLPTSGDAPARYGNQGETPVPQTSSVPQPPQSVPQQNAPNTSMPPNDVVRFHLGELQKEPSNFGNRHANQETVSARVEAKLKAAIVAIGQLPAGCILGTLTLKFEQFLEDSLLRVLETNRIEGEHRALITTLRKVISDRCVAQPATA